MTIADVAKHVGLSPVTVSRALLSAPHKVSCDTRASIERAAKALGYIPDLSASTLASNRSGIVAIVLSTLRASIFSSWIETFQHQLNRAGLHLLIGVSQYSLQTEQELVESFLGRRPDAIVLTSQYHSANTVRLLEAVSIPVLEVWDLSAAPWSYSIGFNNYQAGKAAALHLADRGYRNLIFATTALPDGDSILRRRFQSRWRGFRDAAKRRGAHAEPYESEIASVEIDGGYAIMSELISTHPGIDALFFDSDVLAAGAVLYCTNNGIKMPQQIAICGLGGLPICEVCRPPITTVRIPHDALGQMTASVVLDLINGQQPRRRKVPLEIQLAAGGTT